jgi:dipeptidase E
MKLLLTAGGVTNPSIQDALVGMLGKPIEESTALCIPTAMYGHPNVGPGTRVWQFVSGTSENPMVDLPWKSMGILELTALPSLDKDAWVSAVKETDCLLAAGGDVIYLRYWMQESGLTDLLPELTDTVWVGLSAGSMVMAPQVGYDFVQWEPPTGRTDNSMAEAEAWAATIPGPKYAMDDSSAIAVVDGNVEMVSEGEWRYFPG